MNQILMCFRGDHTNYKFIDEKHEQDKFNISRLAITMFHISPWTCWCLLLDKLSILHNEPKIDVFMGGDHINYKFVDVKHEQDKFNMSRVAITMFHISPWTRSNAYY
jgi:hypothetical protein